MNEAPIPPAELKNLQFLRRLVTVLTATMILGLLTIVVLIVIRFASPATELVLPSSIELPGGAKVMAYTQGAGWFAVVTDHDEILLFKEGSSTPFKVIDVSAEI